MVLGIESAKGKGCQLPTLRSLVQERVVVDESTGRLLTDSTWTYKIPTAICIPQQLNVAFLKVVKPAATGCCMPHCVGSFHTALSLHTHELSGMLLLLLGLLLYMSLTQTAAILRIRFETGMRLPSPSLGS